MRRNRVTLEDCWLEYLSSIDTDGQLGVTISLAHAPLSRVRAGPGRSVGGNGGLLTGIRYDQRLDEIEVTVARNDNGWRAVRYFLLEPRSIVVEESATGKTVRIHDASGLCTVIRLSRLIHYDRPAGALDGIFESKL
jgi:hypothetical protein